MFMIDMRLDPTKCAVVEEAPHTYTRVKFTCHATSQRGHLAIGDADGAVRLYSTWILGKRLLSFDSNIASCVFSEMPSTKPIACRDA